MNTLSEKQKERAEDILMLLDEGMHDLPEFWQEAHDAVAQCAAILALDIETVRKQVAQYIAQTETQTTRESQLPIALVTAIDAVYPLRER